MMNFNDYKMEYGQPYDTGEKCDYCGRPVTARTWESNRNSGVEKLKCACEPERREKERQAKIKAGTAALRAILRIRTGLKKRPRSMKFETIRHIEDQAAEVAICKQYAEDFTTETAQGLLLIGPVGCGKTHMAAAICNALIDKEEVKEEYDADRHIVALPEYEREGADIGCYSKIKFITAVDLFSAIKSTFSKRDESGEDLLDNFKNAPLLVLDDLCTEKATEWTAEKIYEIVDHRYNENLPLIITTNLTLQELTDTLGSRTVDRLREMCRVVTISIPSQRATA